MWYGIKIIQLKVRSVDVDGDVDFSESELVKIPIKFGKVVVILTVITLD
jgi:hypothetical protein